MSTTDEPPTVSDLDRLRAERWEAMEYAYDHQDPYGTLPEWIRQEVMTARGY
jgi:hypothetical protein